jgi:hypothetical protein
MSQDEFILACFCLSVGTRSVALAQSAPAWSAYAYALHPLQLAAVLAA